MRRLRPSGDLQPLEVPHGVRALAGLGAVQRREALEVVPALEKRRRAGDRAQVEGLWVGPAIRPGEGVGVAHVDVIAVDLSLRGKARVEAGRRLGDGDDLEGALQPVAERRGQLFPAVGPLRVEVEHLRAGVHAGVRPPAPVDARGDAQHLREAGLQHVLHGFPTHLTLPAGKPAAVVGARALPAAHGPSVGTPPPGRRPSR